MDEIGTALVRVGSDLLIRHQSATGVVAWLLVLLVIGSVAYLLVAWLHNKTPREKGRHETSESGR
jgi:hypothetical protein